MLSDARRQFSGYFFFFRLNGRQTAVAEHIPRFRMNIHTFIFYRRQVSSTNQLSSFR